MDSKTTYLQLIPVNGTPEQGENTERCCVCGGNGRGDMPGLPCLNCDGCGYIWLENEGIKGLYGKAVS